ncbi:MAG TPA: Maf family protein [Terriglobales bacterium]|nr:Maf family protein [Terriglobales bacterium]
MQIVLASASPRRQELLREMGIEFVVKPANIPEIRFPDELPRGFAERMAREKARAVQATDAPESAVVLGADTIVVIENIVLGKPIDKRDAAHMLRLLSGRKHQVITGVALLVRDFEDVRSESTDVYFSEICEEDIREYVDSGEPMDKAGAYAIQGQASRWISRIDGDYSNVVGLPVALVKQMLRERGAFEI